MDSQRKQAEAAAREFILAGMGFIPESELDRHSRGAVTSLADLILRHMQPQWIPVAERLPDESEHPAALVWAGKSMEPYMAKEPARNVRYYTHWQPLPQPPQPSPDAALDELTAQAQGAGEYGDGGTSRASEGEKIVTAKVVEKGQ